MSIEQEEEVKVIHSLTQNFGNKSVFLGCIEDGDPDCRNDDSDPDDAVGIDLFFEPDPGTCLLYTSDAADE